MSQISRRTIAKGAAWSVPVVAVGAAAPAMAASKGIFELTGAACKLPGNSQDTYKGYAFGVTATNPFNVQITITIESLFIDTTDLGDVLIIQTDPLDATVCSAYPVNTLVIPADTTLTNLVVLTENAANSQQGELTVTYTVEGGPGGTYEATGSAPVTPPIQGASCDSFTAAQKTCISTYIITP